MGETRMRCGLLLAVLLFGAAACAEDSGTDGPEGDDDAELLVRRPLAAGE